MEVRGSFLVAKKALLVITDRPQHKEWNLSTKQAIYWTAMIGLFFFILYLASEFGAAKVGG